MESFFFKNSVKKRWRGHGDQTSNAYEKHGIGTIKHQTGDHYVQGNFVIAKTHSWNVSFIVRPDNAGKNMDMKDILRSRIYS